MNWWWEWLPNKKSQYPLALFLMTLFTRRCETRCLAWLTGNWQCGLIWFSISFLPRYLDDLCGGLCLCFPFNKQTHRQNEESVGSPLIRNGNVKYSSQKRADTGLEWERENVNAKNKILDLFSNTFWTGGASEGADGWNDHGYGLMLWVHFQSGSQIRIFRHSRTHEERSKERTIKKATE